MLARLIAPLALAAFGTVRWGGLVAPGAGARTALGALAALAVLAGGLLARRRLGGRAGVVVFAAATLLALAILLAAAGVRARLLAPAHLDDLWGGLAQGIGDLPGVVVPYHGVDPWARIVIVLGGELLLLAGALGVARSARAGPARALAALPLVVLCAVPMAVLGSHAPAAQGVLLFALLAAFLWHERMPRAGAAGSLWLLALAGTAGAIAVPVLDRPKPWFDYLSLASKLAGAGESFDWSQHYGPIDWPRDGREVLRVRSRKPLYLKAENLDSFDGLRWVAASSHPAGIGNELPDGAPLARFVSTVPLSVRGLRSADVIGAGTTLAVDGIERRTVAAESPGTFIVSGDLARGDSYLATIYYPRPTRVELEHDALGLPAWSSDYLTVGLPARRGRGWYAGGDTLLFFPWGTRGAPPPLSGTSAGRVTVGDGSLRRSPYAKAWALARTFRAASSSPYDYARRVRSYLTTKFTYSESPARAAVPLADFLDRTHLGYCQQFAGAMALLLRMGGVPARVSTGFSPGTYDGGRGEWVVRDFDAHAWVEAWFPSYGWVTFDPTPSASPALRGVTAAAQRGGAVAPGGGDTGRGSAPAPAPAAPGRPAHGGVSAAALVLAAFGLLACLLLVRLLRVRRRRLPLAEAHLAELERALRLTGRAAAPPLTLRALEHRFRGTPAAVSYVRALRAARFGSEVRAPTAEERRGLRSELARGLGPGARLRALRALPPRPRWR